MEEEKSILTKFKENFNKHFSVRKSGLFIATLILIFLFEDKFISFINSHLLTKESFSFYFLNVIILLSSFAFTVLIIKKLIFDKYLPSFSEFYSSFFISMIFFMSIWNADDQNWTFHKDKIFSLCYVFYLLIPLVLFIVLYIMKFSIIYFFSPFKKEKETVNKFNNDDPIFDISNDKLGYSPIVKRLTDILLKEKHKKSFSIGLVGPWGNGKSSIINIVKKEIEKKKVLKEKGVKEPIIVHFLPYLNHSEKDIINEFFIALSSKLSKYNGKLSDEITSYSQKLTDLYSNQNIQGFIDNHITHISNEPAKELYDNINDRLKEVNKKIIVFVDDLDRLNDKEILEVLKLIRNTADFHNTNFLVAMDKQYVLSRLKNNDSILNSSFVEKFFQLEVYLPEIDKDILRGYVYDVLNESLKKIDLEITDKLNRAFSSNFLLFDDYITNFRDAKRVINQIVYDYQNFGKEIDLKDFINFIFFKLKFPKFMKLINEDRFRFLESDLYGNLKLKEKEPENNNGEDLANQISYFRSNVNVVQNYIKKYQIYKDLNLENDDCFEKTLGIDCDDKILLLKTLAHLFGDKNPINYHSIKKENNFRMLMQQRVFENVFLEEEFNQLLKKNSKVEIVNELRNLHSKEKLQQLINRIEYYNNENNDELETVIKIILQLFDKKEELEIHDSVLLNSLGRLVEIKLKDKEQKEQNKTWLKNNIFETGDISTSVKVRILSELWKAQNSNSIWSLKTDYIKGTALKLYDDYLNEKNELWHVSDYTFYGVFHDLKIISNIKDDLKKKMIGFWKDKKIELLCAQTLQIDAFSKSAFNISDFENELFGSKLKFYEFVKNHKDKDLPEIKEYLEFLYLLKIINFKWELKFTFNKSKLIQEKIEIHSKSHLANRGKDQHEDSRQIFLEIDNQIAFQRIVGDSELRQILNYSKFYTDNKNYLYLFFNTPNFSQTLEDFCVRISEILKKEESWQEAKFIKENIIKKESFVVIPNKNFYVKIIAIN